MSIMTCNNTSVLRNAPAASITHDASIENVEALGERYTVCEIDDVCGKIPFKKVCIYLNINTLLVVPTAVRIKWNSNGLPVKMLELRTKHIFYKTEPELRHVHTPRFLFWLPPYARLEYVTHTEYYHTHKLIQRGRRRRQSSAGFLKYTGKTAMDAADRGSPGY